MKRFEKDYIDFDTSVLARLPLPVSIIAVPIQKHESELACMLATSVGPAGKDPLSFYFSVQKEAGITDLLAFSEFVYLVIHPSKNLISAVTDRATKHPNDLHDESTYTLKCEHKLVDESCSNNLYVAHALECTENLNSITKPIFYWGRNYHCLKEDVDNAQ